MTISLLEQHLASPGQRLKHIRSLLGISRTYIQDKYHLPEVTLKSWENGSTRLSRNGAKRCIDVFKSEGLIVSEDWILEGIGLDPTTSLTLSSYFASPSNKALSLEDDEICMLTDANEFKEKYPNAVIMIVSGDEMRPFYKPGDYVGGKMRYGKEIEKTIDRDCIVYLKNGEKYFRRLLKNNQDGYNLSCLNPNENSPEPVLYNVDIVSSAPVIWHRWKDE